MLIVYTDGTTVGTCSLHCAAMAMDERTGKQAISIKVADFNSGKLLEAKSAAWIVGSNQKGLMSNVEQLAFVSKQNAKAFAKRNGGMSVTFEQALKLARMGTVTNKH